MHCPICQADNPPTAASCTSCSTPLPLDDSTRYETVVDRPSSPEPKPGASLAWSIAVTPSAGAPYAQGEELVGTVLAERYEILSLLGQGGMGAVYKARDTELDRLVALKLIRPDLASNPEILRRFKQELILARDVTHRNVIRIFDLGQTKGIKFITMEYVEGRDLRGLLREREKLPPEEAVTIIAQVCRALESAHAAGVVHRDLKPQNIMLDAKNRIYVMDFGIAHSLETPGMTQTGALMGTPEYMSPEQARGMKVDARSDLFALGIIFYELLTGISPFKADSALATLLKRTQERAKPPAEIDPAIPKAISDVVMKCLEIDRDHRFSTAREILEDLGQELPTSVRTIPPTLIPAAVTAPPAPPAAVSTLRLYRNWIAAVLALALLGGAAFILRGRFVVAPVTAHAPVTVIIADFSNHTGDAVFGGTLESTLKLALEGAPFINAYDRTRLRDLGQPSVSTLDDSKAQEIAANQGLNVVISGSLDNRDGAYQLSLRAVQTVSGKVLTTVEETAARKDQVLFAVSKLGSDVRKALGDDTSEADQRFSMETLSAASLEAVHEYAVALDDLSSGKNEDAQKHFSEAVSLDANFGLAYAGLSSTAHNLGQQQDAEKYIKQAITHIDHMTERERYRTRASLYGQIGDSQKCVDEYSTLLTKYPSDTGAYNNMAECLVALRNMPKALEAIRRAVSILPKRATYHVNLALYSAYGGDFQTAASEAAATQQLNPRYVYGYLAEAFANLGQEKIPQAAAIYQKIAAMNPSIAAAGLGDLAIYEGRLQDAVQILQKGAADDSADHKPDAAADKLEALAYTQLLLGHKSAALSAVESALDLSKSAKTRFLSARIYAASSETAKAAALAAGLSSELQTEPQAYGKLIEGELALGKNDARGAVKLFTDANALLDTWIGRFDLGRAYVEIGAFTEADSEFDRCVKRGGESLALFLDEVPTFGYFPSVYYYQGRVREGLKSASFADSYKKYLGIRGAAGQDPLLPEVKRRAGQ
ncbi:MAG TPA: protein kinase [Candidatus Acidoferrales bacterium]|nr:protein kinase [Candidatus Acidoferrales bacterium]